MNRKNKVGLFLVCIMLMYTFLGCARTQEGNEAMSGPESDFTSGPTSESGIETELESESEVTPGPTSDPEAEDELEPESEYIGLTEVTFVSVDAPEAVMPNSAILTKELLDKASKNPEITAENHPRWTGFVLGFGYEHQFDTSEEEISLTAEWGFNSVRVALHYLTLFDQEAQNVDLFALETLDRLVASAIKNNIHLNICLNCIPGRSVPYLVTDFEYTGDFDLFINPDKQQQTFNVYRVLSARYKDVPNFNLSFTPIWEAMNKNLSTGLPYTDYTAEDAAEFLRMAIDVIREEDGNRLIIYEATANNQQDEIIEESSSAKKVADGKGNVMISYNFCQRDFVYACMTAASDHHIDNMNNSMFIPEYPNYIYSVASNIRKDASLKLDGLLPAGTQIDLYLESSNTTLDISADGERIYREKLPEAQYEISDPLSVYYSFATSEKKVSITLTNSADEIVFSCPNDGDVNICGIKISLPEAYGIERWYYAQEYDVYLGKQEETGVAKVKSSEILISPNNFDGGRHITIKDDLSYVSESVFGEASSKTIDAWSGEINNFDGNCMIRFERADFGGTTQKTMLSYYEDLLRSFEEYGYGWWSNDWWLMTDEYAQTKQVAECPSVEYAGYEFFNRELLELLQKYQSKSAE